MLTFENPCFDGLRAAFLIYCGGRPQEEARETYIVKARELIVRDKEVIAAPAVWPPYNVLAIMQKAHLEGQPFCELLKRMKLLNVAVHDVSEEMFHNCLRYTLELLLAPRWNKVGAYSCQGGHEFLVRTGILPAAIWNLHCTEAQTKVSVSAHGIELPPMTLDMLLPEGDAAARWLLQETYVKTGRVPCYVLPSMTAVEAVAVSSKPLPGRFANFAGLKTFWRDIHGYCLPESGEATMLFVRVQFVGNSKRTYTYPIMCVRPTKPTVVEGIDTAPFLTDFETDLRTVMVHTLQPLCARYQKEVQLVIQSREQLLLTAGDAQDGFHGGSATTGPTSGQLPGSAKSTFGAMAAETSPASRRVAERREQGHSFVAPKVKSSHLSCAGASAPAKPLAAPGPSREPADDTSGGSYCTPEGAHKHAKVAEWLKNTTAMNKALPKSTALPQTEPGQNAPYLASAARKNYCSSQEPNPAGKTMADPRVLPVQATVMQPLKKTSQELGTVWYEGDGTARVTPAINAARAPHWNPPTSSTTFKPQPAAQKRLVPADKQGLYGLVPGKTCGQHVASDRHSREKRVASSSRKFFRATGAADREKEMLSVRVPSAIDADLWPPQDRKVPSEPFETAPKVAPDCKVMSSSQVERSEVISRED